MRFRPVSTKTWCRSHLPACSTLGRGWGRSVDGQFGYGVDEIASFSTPVAMTGLLGNAVQVSTSSAATCVLLDDGRADLVRTTGSSLDWSKNGRQAWAARFSTKVTIS